MGGSIEFEMSVRSSEIIFDLIVIRNGIKRKNDWKGEGYDFHVEYTDLIDLTEYNTNWSFIDESKTIRISNLYFRNSADFWLKNIARENATLILWDEKSRDLFILTSIGINKTCMDIRKFNTSLSQTRDSSDALHSLQRILSCSKHSFAVSMDNISWFRHCPRLCDFDHVRSRRTVIIF